MRLDLKDRQLIYELDFVARMPLTKIARKLRISKQVAKYRLERLQKEGIIQGFYTDINATALGLQIYLVYLKFQHMIPLIEREFIQNMGDSEHVGVNVGITGRWDHCIGIWAKSPLTFKAAYEQVMQSYERYIKEKTVMIETAFYYCKPRQIFAGKDEPEIVMQGYEIPFSMDGESYKILSLLAGNARISLVDLAQKIPLSPAAIGKRISDLEKKRIILAYRVMIDYSLLDYYHYRVFFHLENMTKKFERMMIQFLKEQRQVVSVTQTIGYCDLECRIIVHDIKEYADFLSKVRFFFKDSLKEHEAILYTKFHHQLNYFPHDKNLNSP
ncbi:MAG: Lrp/AsnC family transcriptional regulator [Nanoarchaeota archaeon]